MGIQIHSLLIHIKKTKKQKQKQTNWLGSKLNVNFLQRFKSFQWNTDSSCRDLNKKLKTCLTWQGYLCWLICHYLWNIYEYQINFFTPFCKATESLAEQYVLFCTTLINDILQYHKFYTFRKPLNLFSEKQCTRTVTADTIYLLCFSRVHS